MQYAIAKIKRMAMGSKEAFLRTWNSILGNRDSCVRVALGLKA